MFCTERILYKASVLLPSLAAVRLNKQVKPSRSASAPSDKSSIRFYPLHCVHSSSIMPTTYKIYFSNFSGFNNNFAFFSDSPIVVNNGGSPVYGNIVASQYVPADNGDTTFEIDVTKTYYACRSSSSCFFAFSPTNSHIFPGTSICKVDTSTLPGRNVETKISNSKLATLGTPGSPGSNEVLTSTFGLDCFS